MVVNDVIECRGQDASDVIGQREITFGLAGPALIEQVRPKHKVGEMTHQATFFAEVENVGAVDKRGCDEDRETVVGSAAIIKQPCSTPSPGDRRLHRGILGGGAAGITADSIEKTAQTAACLADGGLRKSLRIEVCEFSREFFSRRLQRRTQV